MKTIKNEYESIYNGSKLDEQFKKMTDGRKEFLTCRLSYLDKEVQDILHYLEFKRVKAATINKLVKKLRDILHERRAVKDELQHIQSMTSKIANTKPVEKVYEVKTDVIKEVLGE